METCTHFVYVYLLGASSYHVIRQIGCVHKCLNVTNLAKWGKYAFFQRGNKFASLAWFNDFSNLFSHKNVQINAYFDTYLLHLDQQKIFSA